MANAANIVKKVEVNLNGRIAYLTITKLGTSQYRVQWVGYKMMTGKSFEDCFHMAAADTVVNNETRAALFAAYP